MKSAELSSYRALHIPFPSNFISVYPQISTVFIAQLVSPLPPRAGGNGSLESNFQTKEAVQLRMEPKEGGRTQPVWMPVINSNSDIYGDLITIQTRLVE